MKDRLLELHVNGAARTVSAPPNAVLLDVLRERLGLKGVKRGCDMGTCGCCTVLIDGEARLSCLTLAAQAADHEVTTVEGLGGPNDLHPVQRAYVELGGSQCGFCTPGFIMTTKALLDRDPAPSLPVIQEARGGNLCRCTGYTKIFEAVEKAAADLRQGAQEAR
jgi:aerobic-type carbon monoxide dehydrogenase small subunit (CoxS/CutS family)